MWAVRIGHAVSAAVWVPVHVLAVQNRSSDKWLRWHHSWRTGQDTDVLSKPIKVVNAGAVCMRTVVHEVKPSAHGGEQVAAMKRDREDPVTPT